MLKGQRFKHARLGWTAIPMQMPEKEGLTHAYKQEEEEEEGGDRMALPTSRSCDGTATTQKAFTEVLLGDTPPVAPSAMHTRAPPPYSKSTNA
jgi:hypothetical protein